MSYGHRKQVKSTFSRESRIAPMTTFAKSSFNTLLYSASRPTYPSGLFELVLQYHRYGAEGTQRSSDHTQASFERAVDLGCGTGQATLGLTQFGEVVGVDPSKKMVEDAATYIRGELVRQGKAEMIGKFKFVESQAEKMPFLEKGTVDLVVAAQSAHWFDWNKLWSEFARILRSNGTVAIWGYSEMRFTRYPFLTSLIDEYTHGTDPLKSLGPHWQQPGRSIVENLLRDIPSANSICPGQFFDEQRIYFSGGHFLSISDARPVILRKKMTWESFESYLRSFSALHTFQLRNVGDRGHPDGDIVKRFIKKIRTAMRTLDSHGDGSGNTGTANEMFGETEGKEFEVEWPLAVILAKKA